MSERTQIYLTREQRKRLDELASREGKSLAQVIREAVNVYLMNAKPDTEKVLKDTFGAAPNIAVPPRDEWERG